MRDVFAEIIGPLIRSRSYFLNAADRKDMPTILDFDAAWAKLRPLAADGEIQLIGEHCERVGFPAQWAGAFSASTTIPPGELEYLGLRLPDDKSQDMLGPVDDDAGYPPSRGKFWRRVRVNRADLEAAFASGTISVADGFTGGQLAFEAVTFPRAQVQALWPAAQVALTATSHTSRAQKLWRTSELESGQSRPPDDDVAAGDLWLHDVDGDGALSVYHGPSAEGGHYWIDVDPIVAPALLAQVKTTAALPHVTANAKPKYTGAATTLGTHIPVAWAVAYFEAWRDRDLLDWLSVENPPHPHQTIRVVTEWLCTLAGDDLRRTRPMEADAWPRLRETIHRGMVKVRQALPDDGLPETFDVAVDLHVELQSLLTLGRSEGYASNSGPSKPGPAGVQTTIQEIDRELFPDGPPKGMLAKVRREKIGGIFKERGLTVPDDRTFQRAGIGRAR